MNVRRAMGGALAAAALLQPTWAGAVEEVNGPGAKLFSQRCASCHTIGEGVRVGPDLNGVLNRRSREWITHFVKSPGAAIDSGDPIASELFSKANGVRMPDQTLAPDELNALFDLFTECTQKGGCKPGTGRPRLGTEATAEEIAIGQALFDGTTPLSNGGPACIHCHSTRGAGLVGGGGLGPDLTFAYARLGERGMHPGLGIANSPLMQGTYAQAPLKSEEAFALEGYLAQLSRDGTLPRRDWSLFGLGFAGLLAALGAIGIARTRATDATSSDQDPHP